MQLYCPNCKISTPPHDRCLRCGGRLITPAELESVRTRRESSLLAMDKSQDTPLIAPSPFGRVAVGVISGLGAYVGLREIFMGWVTLLDTPGLFEGASGILAQWVLRLFAVLFGGLFAGAGRAKPGVSALLVGAICAFAFHSVDVFGGRKATQWDIAAMFGLAFCAFPAGLLGGRLWPTAVELPEPEPSSRASSLLRPNGMVKPKPRARSTAWHWIIFGCIVGMIGLVAADPIRVLMKNHLGHMVYLGSPAHASLVACYLALFGITIGGISASCGTGAGARHGLFYGIAMGVLSLFSLSLFGAWVEQPLEGMLILTGLGENPRHPRGMMSLLVCFISYGVVVGFFGGLLLPRLGKQRRRLDD